MKLLKNAFLFCAYICVTNLAIGQYCQPATTMRVDSLGRKFDDYIQTISIGELFNSNTSSSRLENRTGREWMDIGDYSNLSVDVYKERDFYVKIEGSYPWHVEPNYSYAIYIDWNSNGIFDVPEEKVYFKQKVRPTHIVTLSVPKDIPVGGSFRMRIMYAEYLSDLEPCGINSAEWEDYTIKVAESPESPCSKNYPAGCGNIGFEQADYTGWTMYTGGARVCDDAEDGGYCRECCMREDMGATYGNDDPIRRFLEPPWNQRWTHSRYTIVSRAIDDKTKIISTVPPNGGNYALRLGQAFNGAEMEMASYTFTVSDDAPNFAYSYAMVINDPGHSTDEQPFFEAVIYDCSGNIIPCSFSKVTTGTGAEFQSMYDPDFPDAPQEWRDAYLLHYRDWQRVFVDLSNYVGQQLTVQFTVGDCTIGAHFGYAYVDVECEPLSLDERNVTICKGESTTIVAPEGNGDFSYLWNTGDTTKSITVAPVEDTNIYTVTMVPKYGCTIKLTDTVFVIEGIEVSQPTVQCNDDNTYIVEFLITGGNPDNYTVDGIVGTFSGTGIQTFTSEPISNADTLTFTITDGGCKPFERTANHECPSHCKAYPYVQAGADATVCMTSPYQFADAIGLDIIENIPLSDSFIIWRTKDGLGSFNDTATLHPTYTPVPEDAGKELTFYIIGRSGDLDQRLCPDRVDSMTLTIEKQPIVDAGEDGEICSAGKFQVLNSDTSLVSGFIWSHNGDGFLENDSTLTPIYNPSNSDVDNNSVLLFLIAVGKAPCNNAQDTAIITFSEDPNAEAGEAQIICLIDTLKIEDASISGGTPNWSTNGDGTLLNKNSIEPSYIPSIQDTGKTISLFLHSDAEDPCIDAFDTTYATIIAPPTVDPGISGLICGTDSLTLNGSTSNTRSFYWSHDGGGSLKNSTNLSPTYLPGRGDYGSTVYLTLTGLGIEPCPQFIDSISIEVQTPPSIYAGDSTEVCAENSVFIENIDFTGTRATWSTSGSGTVDAADSLSPIYESVTNDSSRFVYLILEVQGDSLCALVSDTAVIWVAPPVSVEAGEGRNVCVASSFEPVDANVVNTSVYFWTHNGAGTLENDSTLIPSYFPGTTDVDKEITLILHAVANQPCDQISDSVTITVTGNARAEAGDPIFICAGDSLFLSEAEAYGYSNISWTQTGTGDFIDNSILEATYVSNPNDGNSTIQLILLSDADDPCLDDRDTLDVYIQEPPVANAGTDHVICVIDSLTVSTASAENNEGVYWTHNGTGALEQSNTLTPIYIPTPADANQEIHLVLHSVGKSCPEATDTTLLTINAPALVDAGSPDFVCVNGTFVHQTAQTDGTNLVWESNGIGQLNNSNVLTVEYAPDASEAGDTILFTLSVNSETPCPAQSDSFQLIIIDLPLTNAGDDATICYGESFTISNASASLHSFVEWTHDGEGVIELNNSITPTYHPNSNDAGNIITLTSSANPFNPCIDIATDQMEITILSPPVIEPIRNLTICEGTQAEIQLVVSNDESITWSVIKGNGALNIDDLKNPIYTPAANEAGSSATLEVTVTGTGSCPTVTERVKIRIIAQPIVSIGEPTDICIYDLHQLNGTVENAASFTWTYSGTGVLENETSLAPTYRPSYEDRNTVVQFTLSARATSPCSQDVVATSYVRIVPAPGVYAGADRTICAGETLLLNDPNAVDNLDVEWTILDPQGIQLDTYSSAPTSFSSKREDGGKRLTMILTANPLQPCKLPVTDTVNVIIQIIPEFIMEDGEVCPGQTFLMAPQPVNEYPVNIYDWYTDSIGSDLVHTGEMYDGGPYDQDIQYWVEPSRGCRGERVPVNITWHPSPVALFSTDTNRITDQYFEVQFMDESKDAVSGDWIWGDGDSSSYVPGDDTSHLYQIEFGNVPDSYMVTLSVNSEFGCQDEAYLEIPVRLIWNLFVPNAFSPNSDNLNEEFGAVGYGIDQFEMWIFNRWGDNIYYTQDISNYWDGKDYIYDNSNSVVQTDDTKKVDTYVYKIRFRTIFGEVKTFLGEANLIR